MVMTKDFQRLGDIAAGTLTVYESTQRSVGDIPAAPAVQPGCTLTVDEQTALVHFSERLQGINWQRAEELADLAVPLTGVTGKQGVEAIVQMANWIAGRR
jgi:hypothetical protein